MKPNEVKAEATKILNTQGISQIDARAFKLMLDKARRMSRLYFGCVSWTDFFGEFADRYLATFYLESLQGTENTSNRRNADHARKMARS